jgi:protoporphyrinogen oxidase
LHSAAPGVVLAGASYRGIGIPACINDGQRAASRALSELI